MEKKSDGGVLSKSDTETKRVYTIVFVVLLVDLLAFTCILPLMPALFDYYGSRHDQVGWLLSQRIAFCMDYGNFEVCVSELIWEIDDFDFCFLYCASNWLSDWWCNRSIDWLIDWSIVVLVDWLIDRSIDWLIDRLLYWLIGWLTWSIDWLIDLEYFLPPDLTGISRVLVEMLISFEMYFLCTAFLRWSRQCFMFFDPGFDIFRTGKRRWSISSLPGHSTVAEIQQCFIRGTFGITLFFPPVRCVSHYRGVVGCLRPEAVADRHYRESPWAKTKFDDHNSPVLFHSSHRSESRFLTSFGHFPPRSRSLFWRGLSEASAKEISAWGRPSSPTFPPQQPGGKEW